MLKSVFAAIAVVFIFYKGYTQQPEKILNQWAEANPIEKIYFHFDRSGYIAGQTIWFKVYLYSDFLPDNKSTTLFVELLNASSSMVSRQVLPVFNGFTRGQVELPDTLPGGSYILRAYTATMLNHDPDFIYKRKFFVFSKIKNTETEIVKRQRAIMIDFFPEGGNFVTDLSNSIAYKAIDENGSPVAVSGIVKNEKGANVAEFTSFHDGMGFFDLTAAENDNYYAVLKDDTSGKKYPLPQQTVKGIVFRVISAGVTKSFEILQRNDNPAFKASYIIGQMQHHVVFKKMCKQDGDEITGIIPAEKFSSGILQLTVFNKDGLPIAERLTFVDNKEYVQQGDILPDTINFSDREKNHFTLSLKDTVKGSFSISVSDPVFDLHPVRQENIFSGLLLTSDLKGYVHDPAYYFSATNDSVQNALDLVMMTNGWRRFKWDELLKNPLSAKKYSDQGYIALSGKISLEGTKKPFANKDLLMFTIAGDSGRSMEMIHTDAEGRFKKDSIIFFGSARVLITDIKGKKSRFIDVKLDGDSLNKTYILPLIYLTDFSLNEIFSSDRDKKMFDEYNAAIKAEGIMLEGVTVTGRKKTALEETEGKYVSSLFSGDANSTLDLTKEDLMPYRDIFDYLKLRVPGLQILNDPEGPGYIVKYRQQATISAMGEIPMTIFLNEIPSDADAIATIPAYEIALVKVYSSFVGAAGNAPGGVLAIYTKKGTDLSSLPSSGDMINYKGYSIIKEFYSPDYKIKASDKKPDHRITLYWNPVVFVNGINPIIPITFYNNDRTKQFKIVIEGMTEDGKMLMIEKIIGSKKAF